jgi:YkoY family integral membrane protein
MTTATLLIIFNLFVLESLLSVDNAAVLAIMVKDLPDRQKKKALRYGLLGAYVFRGLCLFAASWLVKILWLKIAGGLYLLYLVYGHFTKKNDSIEEASDVNDSKIYRFAGRLGLNRLWATVVLVEIMDLAFSIDNVFAAVALSNNFYIIMTGVAIGILAMRFVAGWFVSIIERFPSLEQSAFIVIALLGIKLIFSGTVDYIPSATSVKIILENHWFDLCFSGIMMLIFFLPLLFIKNHNTKKVSV